MCGGENVEDKVFFTVATRNRISEVSFSYCNTASLNIVYLPLLSPFKSIVELMTHMIEYA